MKTVPTARDTVGLDYKVIVISDALCGRAHGLHEATLGLSTGFSATPGRARMSSGYCADWWRGRKFLQVAARACQWIEQEFPRLFHPQTLDL